MHHPPAVSFPVRASPWSFRLVATLLLLGLIQVMLFLSRNPLNGWQPAVLGAGLLMSMGLVWFFAQSHNVGELHWSGETWQWLAFSRPGDCSLRLHLDFQFLMLVSLRRSGVSTVWLWLERDQSPLHWLALRRAIVYAAAAPSRHVRTATPPSSPL